MALLWFTQKPNKGEKEACTSFHALIQFLLTAENKLWRYNFNKSIYFSIRALRYLFKLFLSKQFIATWIQLLHLLKNYINPKQILPEQ